MNYDVEFIIVGGILRVDAQVLARELLKKDSILRSFVLASKSNGKPPKVIKEQQWVTIDFTGAEVALGCALEEAFTPIKQKYKGKIIGSVSCMMKYTMMQGVSMTTVDFPTE